MAYLIRLSDEDRERIGCEEWLTLDLTHLPVEEAEAIELATGKTWDVLLDSGAASAKARLWFALKRAGVDVPYGELTFDLLGMRVRRDDVDDDDPGKASDGDEPNTPPTSASSSQD